MDGMNRLAAENWRRESGLAFQANLTVCLVNESVKSTRSPCKVVQQQRSRWMYAFSNLSVGDFSQCDHDLAVIRFN
jgi:hypothetical protein